MRTVATLLCLVGVAQAQDCPSPNPNIYGPPFVANCPLPAESLNRLAPTPPWSPEILQVRGGLNRDHNLVWADQNTLMTGDLFAIQSQNPGLAFVTVSGTPTPGESPGVTLVVNAISHTVTYTVQASDTTTDKVAAGLANCLQNDTDAPVAALGLAAQPHCSGYPTSLTDALLAMSPKYWTAAGPFGSLVAFDVPLPQSTYLAGVSTAHLTVTTNPNGLTSGIPLDNGPAFGTVTNNPGRPGHAGDQLGFYRMDGQDSNGAADVQYGGIFARIVDPNASAPVGKLCVGTANGGGQTTVNFSGCFSKGLVTDDGGGTSNMLPDLGYGSFHAARLVSAGTVDAAKGSVFAAPGAGLGRLMWVPGTNPGTCKLVALAGTSATPVTVVDNVGAGC